MRLVFLNPSGQLGGAERSLLDVLASLKEARPEWDLSLVVSDDGPLRERAEDVGVRVVVVPFPPEISTLGDAAVRGPAGDRVPRSILLRRLVYSVPAVVRYLISLRRTLRMLRPDLVHTNGFKMHVFGVWSAGRRVPVVWHLHDYLSRRPVMSRLLRWHISRCSAIVTNSLSVADDVRSVCGSPVPIAPVYNGVDLDDFSPDGERLDVDAAAGLPPAPAGTVRVGLVATLGRWKGHAVFLHALSRLPPELPVRGYIIGGALYQTAGSQYGLDEVRTLAKDLGIADRVGFTGHLAEPAGAMRAMDVVVHASTEAEPFGLVIAEGMACGRAVIASQAGGSAELFTSRLDALGHPPGDVQNLADCIAELVLDAELRAKLGRNGREAAERRFDRRRLAAELAPVYELVSEARTR